MMVSLSYVHGFDFHPKRKTVDLVAFDIFL